MTFEYDAQNPWFSKQQDTTTPPTTPPVSGGNGAGGTSIDSTGWDWSKGFHNSNPAGDLNSVLDSSKWQDWSNDDWRLATGGFGNNESSFLGGLQKNMGNDALYHNYMNTYGVGGQRFAPGGYDWTTHKMNYSDVPAEALAKANSGAMFGSHNMTPDVGASNMAWLRSEQAMTAAQLEKQRQARLATMTPQTHVKGTPGGVLKAPYSFAPPVRPGTPVVPDVTSIANLNRLRHP